MGLIVDNTEIENVTYNGVELDKVVYNGVTVWEKKTVATDPGIYDDNWSLIMSWDEMKTQGYIEVTSGVLSQGSNSSRTSTTGHLVISDEVTSIADGSSSEGVFYRWMMLKSVKFPDTLTRIGDYAFYYCVNLATLELPNSLVSIGNYAFYSCVTFDYIKIPDSVRTIGSYAFGACTYITSIDLGNGVETIRDHAFQSCTGSGGTPTELKIPKSVISIENDAFFWCHNIVSLVFESGGSVSIGSFAFGECDGLKSIDFKNSVISIGTKAFTNCIALRDTSVYIPKTIVTMGAQIFYNSTNYYFDMTANCEVSSKPDGWDPKWAEYSTTWGDIKVNWGV